MRRFRGNMLEGPLLPSIIQYTIPIILTSILQLLFNAADLVVVGQFCGSASVAAVGATGSVTNLIITLFVGLSSGAGVTVAQAIGSGDQREIQRTVHTALPIAMLGGVILTVVGVVLAEPILKAMGTPENILPLSVLYMRTYFCGMIFNMVYNFSASILRAAGDTRSPMVFLTIAGVVNVILNVIFVTAFHMDVMGVALATVISQGISAVLVILVLINRRDGCQLVLSKLHIYFPQLKKIVRIGLPAGIQSSLFSISNTLIQSSINSFGDAMVAGSSAAVNIEGFVYTSMNAFQQTSVNFTGQNVGARQYDRVKKILAICIAAVSVVGLITGVSAYVFGEQLLSIYITDSPEAIAYGMIRLAFFVPYFLCGIMEVSTGALRGMGASMTPMVITVLGACGVRLAWIYTIFQIPRFHTPECLFFSYTVSWILTLTAQLIAFSIVYRKQVARDKLL